MPPRGHRSVTLREDDYNFFLDKYEQEKTLLSRRGVRSFSAYITMMLYKAIGPEKHQ